MVIRLLHRIYIYLLKIGLINPNFRDKTLGYILRHVKVGSVVFDIGSNRGTYTTAFCRAVGSNGRVFSFEPNIQLLTKYSYAYEGVSLLPIGLSNATGIKSFYIHLREAAPTSSLLFIPELFQDGEVSENHIFVTTLDSIYSSFGIDYSHGVIVKIDVEGAEKLVLEGMAEFVEKFRPIIFFEFIYRLNSIETYKWLCNFFTIYSYKLSVMETGVNFYDLNFTDNSMDCDVRTSTNINICATPLSIENVKDIDLM